MWRCGDLSIEMSGSIRYGAVGTQRRQIGRSHIEIIKSANRTSQIVFPGGHRSRVTPVPIPNTEVKPATADGTACVGAWESRSLPGFVSDARFERRSGRSYVLMILLFEVLSSEFQVRFFELRTPTTNPEPRTPNAELL